MKDKRPGEELWLEWEGEGYLPLKEDCTIYYTFENVDTTNEVVRRALASALQRDGLVHSLGDGFRLLENCVVDYMHCGYLEGELQYIVCSPDGETRYGDFVEKPLEITLIEI
jgi:hypothetical protein